jgi:carbon-monoxide dehydrogenase medium subunit
MRWTRHECVSGVAEAVERLARAAGQARIVAGGTDVMVELRDAGGSGEDLTLLDVSRVEEMRGVTEVGDHLRVGAAATMAEVAASPLVRAKAGALAQGAGWLGSPQIRNVATIGGNVVSAQPVGDTSVPLVALGASAHIVSPQREGDVPVEDLFLGVGQSAVDPYRELITHFLVPKCEPPNGVGAMLRMAKRKAFTLSQLSVCVRVASNGSPSRCADARIVVAPVAPTPWRARRAEEALAGGALSADDIDAAAALAREDAQPRDSLRGGREYRRDMVRVLVRRALAEAVSRLQEVPHD